MRLGQGEAWSGSRHDGLQFVAVSHGVMDGAYSDDEIDRLLLTGELVAYGNHEDGLFPAGDVGLAAVTELFLIGAGQVEDALDAGGSLDDAVRPLTAALLGMAGRGQGPDVVSLGRLWAIKEYAKGIRPLVDLDPKVVAAQVYDDLVAVERSREPSRAATPVLRTLH